MHIRRTMLRSLTISFLVLSLAVATPIIACYYCKASPDGMFGFCDPTLTRGWNDCTTYVTDTFNGRTSCNLTGNNCPYGPGDVPPSGGGGGGGGGGEGSDDCWWTNFSLSCDVY